ncbi:CHAT domain-containing protein, partial [Candidatus Venteria ishoeyi]|uniref:CHAT domain-containing protein n=1 Tax=Candidatus Venteria ishoeyi TaxID=1899563 RepID=UPI0025A5BC7E
REAVLGKEHPDTLISVNNLAGLYESQGSYGEAEPLYQRALRVREAVLGKEHPDTLISVNNLAGLYKSQGRYGEAEPLYQRALRVSEAILGQQHPQTLTSLNNLAFLYQAQGRYGEAEQLYQRVLRMNEKILGKEHPTTLNSINTLAVLYYSQGRYSEAEPLYQQVLYEREMKLGKKHPETLKSISNLASCIMRLGRYNEAEPLYQRALDTVKKVLGKEHPQTFDSVNDLAVLYQAQGRYGEAESLYQHAKIGREKVLGKEHSHTLSSINNLAGLYYQQNRYSDAEFLYQLVLDMNEQKQGMEHPRTLISINNLALLYQAQNRYEKAKSLFQRALRVREEILGKEHPDTLISVNNLANLYQAQGNYHEAEPLFQRALLVRKQVLGEEHPDTLTSIDNLANFYQAQERYGEAESLFQQVLRARKKVLGKEHPDTMHTMQSMISLQLSLKQAPKALVLLRHLETAALRYTAIELSTTLGEAQKRSFLSQQSVLQDLALNLAVQYPSKETHQFAVTVLLRWNQVQGEEALFLQRLSRQSGDPQIKELAEQIRATRKELSFLANQKEVNSQTLQTLLNTLAAKEVQLSRHSRLYKQHLVVRSLDLNSVRSELPHSSALLAVKAYRPFDTEKQILQAPHYLALLLPAEDSGETALQLKDLGPVEETGLSGQILKAGEAQTEKDLYQQLFADWDEQLAAYESLYIVPDHWLHLLNFERMRLADGRYWIERQPLHRLSNARDLLRPPPLQKGKGLVALGGIDYGTRPVKGTGAVVGAGLQPAPEHLTALTDTQRNLAGQLEQGFLPLAASRKEAKQIPQFFWSPAHGDDQSGKLEQVWLGADATEHKLKQLDHAPQVLHLATHGFYLEDRLELGRPLVLSGLALANANLGIHGQRDEHGEDGILYALEVQDLNLEGTQLVTLSACDTGKGVVDYAEGVYGLIRAFRVAGARNVLMTLRKVDDEQAFRFMTEFYRRWLESGGLENPAKALRDTKLHFLGKGESVEMWAPYVLVEVL